MFMIVIDSIEKCHVIHITAHVTGAEGKKALHTLLQRVMCQDDGVKRQRHVVTTLDEITIVIVVFIFFFFSIVRYYYLYYYPTTFYYPYTTTTYLLLLVAVSMHKYIRTQCSINNCISSNEACYAEANLCLVSDPQNSAGC